jgi:arabinan endo-1,5-alpha-L-arabinosidase
VIRAWRGVLAMVCAAFVVATGVAGCVVTGVASAQPASVGQISNPQRDGLTGRPLSCPDPSVINAVRGKWRYFLFCTSDAGKNAFPIWMSEDLTHWYPDGWVFPSGTEPSWAVHSTGVTHFGRFWAPSIYRMNGHWVLYFAAEYNDASHALGKVRLPPKTMVLGVATSNSLSGPWHSQVLHYAGEFNAYNRRPQQERGGGDIDPGVVRDPRTGQLYIFWAEQREQIWEGALSPNGLSIARDIRVALGVTEPWECDPANKTCTIEGPEPFYHDGKIFLMYSAANTWDSSYSVGVAASTEALNALDPFVKLPEPILRTGNGFLGPGRTSHPITGPGGQSLILYHALLGPIQHHFSAARTLMLGRLNWVNGWPLINDGTAS